ncbi:MAG: SpoIIE family protein phosphatase [bacterium]|nr:SpoIIE family protein phosphatase [bacterium]
MMNIIPKKYIIIVSIFILFVLTGCELAKIYEKDGPKAVHGVIDLTSWDFSDDGIVKLDGEWSFYWKQLLSPSDFASENVPKMTGFFSLPGLWNYYSVDGKSLPGEGYGTYRLIAKVSENRELSLNIHYPYSSYKVWINGKELFQVGKVGKNEDDSEAAMLPKIIKVPPGDSEIEIVIQVANHSYFLGGIYESVRLGRIEYVNKAQVFNVAFDLFLTGVLFFVGFYYIGVYLLRRKDRFAIFFGFFSLSLVLRTLATNEIFLAHIVPEIGWELLLKCNFVVMALSVALFLPFIYHMYPEYLSKKFKTVISVIGIIYALVVFAFSVNIYSYIFPFYCIIVAITCISVAYSFIKAIIDRREGAILATCGFLILFAAVMHDILTSMGIIYNRQVVSLGFMFFVVTQAFNLTARFSKALSKAENLSEILEHKVLERTKELEFERNKLKERNEIIEKDLHIARKIQEQLIPLSDPTDFICSLYKPMELVGGDFYDFIEFDEKDKIGIFLSDVSGHGVQAAFVTLLMKSVILQAGTRKNDPAELLAYVNELLLDQTGGNFITAFYAIYDTRTSKLVYASAGHNPPFVISAHGTRKLSGKRSIPIGVLDNDYIKEKGKALINNEEMLDKNSKLLIYTDGLTETPKSDNIKIHFEDYAIYDVFERFGHLRGNDFIEKLFQNLIMFRGRDSFEDDVCIITIDV